MPSTYNLSESLLALAHPNTVTPLCRHNVSLEKLLYGMALLLVVLKILYVLVNIKKL